MCTQYSLLSDNHLAAIEGAMNNPVLFLSSYELLSTVVIGIDCTSLGLC